jgi:hypothetical protein
MNNSISENQLRWPPSGLFTFGHFTHINVQRFVPEELAQDWAMLMICLVV